MGGMNDGANCASLAVASFVSSCIKNRRLSLSGRLVEAVTAANIDVYTEFKGSGGTTLSAFIIDDDGSFHAINVGDSRIYVTTEKELHQISTDDTIAGQLNRKDPPSHLDNKLLQYIGLGNDLEPHLLEMPTLSSIQKIVITSDGIHYLDGDTLSSLTTQNIAPLELSKRLIQVAKWCGGHDNSTVITLSDFQLILDSNESARTGSVQLWDAYGDVQLIGIEKFHQNERQAPKLYKAPLQSEVSSENVENMDNVDESTSEDGKEALTKKPTVKRKTKKSDGKGSTRSKPQLRIDFDEQ
jgi:serine/threonine protein phosphatase PrpC